MFLPLSRNAWRGPVSISSLGMSSLDCTLTGFCAKYGTIWSSVNSNSLTESPSALYRTFLWSSLSRADLSSMRTMSENPERMAECAKGDGVPVKWMSLMDMAPESIMSRTCLAFFRSMSSSITSR